jgi:DNA-binding NarL/FixJ family response regulator
MSPTSKVVVIEDDPVFTAMLTAAVSESHDLQLVACAATVKDGLTLLQGAPADVLLVDLGLPDGSGLQIIAQARFCWPECEIMVISVFGDRTSILAAITAGASGYLLKDMPKLEVAQEIRTLIAGGSAISPGIARELLQHVRQVEERGLPLPNLNLLEPSISLTQREYEVLVLTNKGLTFSETASSLGLSVHTVRTYVKRAYRKLQVTSKTEALYELRSVGKIFD